MCGMAALTDYEVVDRIVEHLDLTFAAGRKLAP